MILGEAVDAGNSTFQPQYAAPKQTARKSKESSSFNRLKYCKVREPSQVVGRYIALSI